MSSRLLPLALAVAAGSAQAAAGPCHDTTMDQQVETLMTRHDIPGVSVAWWIMEKCASVIMA